MVKTGSLPSEGGISWLFAFRGVSHLFTFSPFRGVSHFFTFSPFHLFTFSNE